MEHTLLAPTARIAGLCHSIARIEPYTTCQLACAYCYARWYRGPHAEPRPLYQAVKTVRVLARLRREAGIILPGRLATQSDPFQPAEASYRVTLRVLREALRHGVPIILNTRVEPPGADHWEAVESLAGEGLLIAQVSLTGLQEDWRWLRQIEPGSPPPEMRLLLASKFARAGAPTVVRVQPLIPGSSIWKDPRSICRIREARVRGVIAEVLRAEEHLYRAILRLTGAEEPLEEYSPGTGVYTVASHTKRDVLSRLSGSALSCGLGFQTCKEGLPSLHHPPGTDCCYMKLFGIRVSRRPTLVDLYSSVRERGRVELAGAVRRACEWVEAQGFDPLCSWRPGLPGWLRRALRRYERMMVRVLERAEIRARLVPDLEVRGGFVEAIG